MHLKSHLRPAHIAILTMALLISGCSSGARSGAMTAGVTADTLVSDSSPVKSAIQIGKVAGGSDTNPLWRSEVSNENFRVALEQSLALHAMTDKSGKYMLNAELISLDQPFAGFDMEVTALVHYTLVATADGSVKLDETVKTPFTATMGDSMLGVERLRLANEGAIKANINQIIVRIIAAAKTGNALVS
jgi:hypothetical protein